ncbi:activator-dependent family glycosyltransferase [Streptomyces sp. V1I1]|uniref:activator-dependent family glycosyltransferase n=1 Tax=Streptomyces sp. V1I1 TaxID=3042272 RepID=UPI00278AEAA3|nr:activator-dependent family glycosyltransferase [Streptomyces sp. V1I1]MDQ0940757.1 glycosyltransferase (activator-dependent family) [Streptomyces sp. V1I1]
MRVIFTSFALDAHFLGQVPLAWALRSAGHEVRIVSQPALTGTINAAGLTAVPVGDDHTVLDALAGTETEWDATLDLDPARPEMDHWEFLQPLHEEVTNRFFRRANNDSMIEGLVRFARAWRPDLVISEPFTLAGAIAAEVTGAAHARLLWGADLFLDQRQRFLRELANRPAAQRTDPLAQWLGGVLDRYGLVFDERLVRGQWTIDQMPSGVRLPLGERTLPMRYIPYNGTAVVPDWLREPPARPRVCLTMGITSRGGAEHLTASLSNMFDAVADLDVEIVATLNAAQREQVPRLPDNVRAVDFVPLHALLPTCSAIAHHGGAGTWSTACASGVPQLIFPSVWDDFYRARRTAEVGAGLVIPSAELTSATLREGLRRLLEESHFSDGAERLRREMLADPAPSDVVPLLEKLTLEHQDPGW